MKNRLFNKEDRSLVGVFVFVWVLGALLSLGVTGVVIWGIVSLVTHFTSWEG